MSQKVWNIHCARNSGWTGEENVMVFFSPEDKNQDKPDDKYCANIIQSNIDMMTKSGLIGIEPE